MCPEVDITDMYHEWMVPDWDLPLAEKIGDCQEECGKTYGYCRVHITLKDQIKRGLQIYSTSTLSKGFCICRSSEICMTTVLFSTRPERYKTSIWF